MGDTRIFRIIESSSAAIRLNAAAAFLHELPSNHPATIVGATRGAADDLARAVAASRPATFGLHRLSLTQLAARTAIVELARHGLSPSSWLGAEAVAARAAFDATRDGALRYFEPVAGAPGFPRALAATLHELRLAGVSSDRLERLPLAGPDLARLLTRVESCFDASATADRADLFRTAARLLEQRPITGALVLLDLPIDQHAEAELVSAAISGAGTVLATAPHGDRSALQALVDMGGTREKPADSETGDLACLRRFLFNTEEQPPARTADESLELFSAPGEGRECVEIVRRLLREARRGVRFDDMAILVRSPRSYFGLLEQALGRADVPAWFDRGTRRPHPAGRAFLALLACAAERLSAARFAEYLSLGQVPQMDGDAPDGWTASRDEALGREDEIPADELETEERESESEPADADRAVVAGTLRAPWRWERLLIDAVVIGNDADRWRRRLAGHAGELRRQQDDARREDGPDSVRFRGFEITLEQLEHLRRFALPIVEELGRWPAHATWGEWLEHFEALVPRVLRVPAYVRRVLADLRPMADVGPIDLDEARRVLTERLLLLESEPPSRRFGRVFVGTPQQARGRSFRVVFVPGLAERMFPQKAREDPLLLDEGRRTLVAGLPTQDDRLPAERLLLQIASGAARERLYVSYPRIELSESRARVPSFYALDVMRAVTGRLPDHEWLEERARVAGGAMLSWPAPPCPDDAIDDQEHDLAVLRRLLDEKARQAVRGHAHYLLGLNECLRRSVIDRWARGQVRWSPSDGLTGVSPQTMPALAAHRLTARSYSLSALQKFTACPYQFVLSAIYRLQPVEAPEPLQRMNPLTRGSIFHDIQARFLREMRARDALPVTSANVDAAERVLDEMVDHVTAREHDTLAPAVERVWADEVGSIRRDLRAWLGCLAKDGAEWEPRYFELGFGRVPGERDAGSRREEVTLAGGFRLRGAIDLIEEHRQLKFLRVTDHKTGRTPEAIEKVIIGGGAVLQPVLYGMAVEAALGTRVSYGRLFYCTSAGSFAEHGIPLNDATRANGLEVLRIIDRAVETGFLAAAPAEEACSRCDFRPVCGPGVRQRVQRKPQDKLADLLELRSRP
ncbi:MAG TPA: PD-(D/E)XK nuclease family protein [Vicinamibacterales bacterium]